MPHARNLPSLLRATTVTANHAAATEKLAAQVRAGTRPAPDLVIWPENSTDLDPRLYPPVYASIAGAVRAIDRPVLVGEVLRNPLRNAGQLWTPDHGPGQVYVKRQLVPFGEYIPFRGLLSHITSLVALQPQNFTAGRRAVVFHVGKIRLGDVICYEVGFDGLVSSEVRAGANLLAVQTNDATFEVDGQLGESLQQLAMARIRAVESDRAVVVASTTGVSAIIAPDGSLIARTGTWRQAILGSRVPLLVHGHPGRPPRRRAGIPDHRAHRRRVRLGGRRPFGAARGRAATAAAYQTSRPRPARKPAQSLLTRDLARTRRSRRGSTNRCMAFWRRLGVAWPSPPAGVRSWPGLCRCLPSPRPTLSSWPGSAWCPACC